MYARGSPPNRRPVYARGPTGPPVPTRSVPQWVEDEMNYREGNPFAAVGVDSIIGRVVARVLMWLLVLQPVYVAFGMELAPESVSDQAPVTEQQQVSDTTPPTESADAFAQANETTDESAILEADATHTVSQSDDMAPVDTGMEAGNVSDATEHTASETDSVEGTATAEGTSGNTEDITGDDAPDGTENGVGAMFSDASTTAGDTVAGSTTDPVVSATGTADSVHATGTASSTDEAAQDDTLVPVAQNATNKYVFGEGDCTMVADGQFYCVASGAERQASGDPRVYAEKDREGDREIFYFDGVEVKRITNNSYDDFAPSYDAETQRIVWQANIGDRMQIMLYEIPTNTTRQITDSRDNSTNPNIRGDIVVWQQWVDTNWEIMMTNVNNGGQAFEIERLTDNAVHDMFPQVYEGLVTWQSERGASWEVVVYDLHTEKRTTLEKSAGTKYENPRFALLFDSKHDNGDVETVGYDLNTGEMMKLGTTANKEPVAPASPKDKAGPEALPREATSTSKVKVGREDDARDDVS